MRLKPDEKAAIREHMKRPGYATLRNLVAPEGWPPDAPVPADAADRAMHLSRVGWRAENICIARRHRANATRARFV